MGTRINVKKGENPKCPNGHSADNNGHCQVSTCEYRAPKGSDGDTADYYNPDINDDNPLGGESMPRHEKN
jgi:hypothetical protein